MQEDNNAVAYSKDFKQGALQWFVYLSCISDLCSGIIASCELTPTLETRLVLNRWFGPFGFDLVCFVQSSLLTVLIYYTWQPQKALGFSLKTVHFEHMHINHSFNKIHIYAPLHTAEADEQVVPQIKSRRVKFLQSAIHLPPVFIIANQSKMFPYEYLAVLFPSDDKIRIYGHAVNMQRRLVFKLKSIFIIVRIFLSKIRQVHFSLRYLLKV